MIELMFVIGIAAMIMSLGIPAFVKVLNKDPMRQTISDMLEACTEARAQAIISGAPAELRIRPGDRSVAIGVAARQSNSSEPSQETQSENRPAPRQVTGKGFPKHISDQLTIEMLDVNLKEMKDEDEARIRFYPNGASDEFTLIVSWSKSNEYRQISLDSISGLASVSTIR
jgi:Tfp pilus assembly protein FimT